jgi:hypothetical protein
MDCLSLLWENVFSTLNTRKVKTYAEYFNKLLEKEKNWK